MPRKQISKQWKCSRCLIQFESEQEFKIHTKVRCEIEGDVHQCDVCPFKTASRTGLHSHQRRHAREKQTNPIKCNYCRNKKYFKSKENLLVHCHYYHPEKTAEMKEIISQYNVKVKEIEEAKKAEELIRETEQVAETSLQTSPQPVLVQNHKSSNAFPNIADYFPTV